VQWEVARRYGRSQVVEITSDSWRDSNGHLWQPNTLCRVSRPQTGFKKELLIAEIEFVQGESGTHANLVLMPPQAFKPQPLVLPLAQSEGVAAAIRNT
jgi:prophage tail gpP-like protein